MTDNDRLDALLEQLDEVATVTRVLARPTITASVGKRKVTLTLNWTAAVFPADNAGMDQVSLDEVALILHNAARSGVLPTSLAFDLPLHPGGKS